MLEKLNHKNVFLFDAAGAVMSALTSGVFLPLVSHMLGIERFHLYFLAIFPVCYAVYSASCYFLTQDTKPWMMRVMIAANVAYCLISAFSVRLSPEINVFGLLVLGSEIFTVGLVVLVEIFVYRRSFGIT